MKQSFKDNLIVQFIIRHYFLITMVPLVLILLIINLFILRPTRPNFESHPTHDLETYETMETSINSYPFISTFLKEVRVIQTASKGKLVLVKNEKSFDSPDQAIGKYDQDYEVEWEIYGGYTIDQYKMYMYDVVELKDGIIVGVGRAYKQDHLNEGDLVVVTLNDEGRVASYQLFSDLNIGGYNFSNYDKDFRLKIVSTTDGGYTTFTNDLNDMDSLIIHFNVDDDVVWNKTIMFNELTPSSIKVVTDNEGNYYLYNVSKNLVVNDKIMKISPNGDTIWEKQYDFQIISLSILNNKLYVSGFREREIILNLKLKYLINIDNAYDPSNKDHLSAQDNTKSYGGNYTAVTASIDLNDAGVNWLSDYNYSDNDFYNFKLFIGSDGYLYSMGIHSDNIYSSFHDILFITKYDMTGKRIGETNLNFYQYIHDIFDENASNLTRFYLEDDQITYYNRYNRQTVDLNQVKWHMTQDLIYDELVLYNSQIHQIATINRILLIIIAIDLVISINVSIYRIKKRDVQSAKNLKERLGWEENNK